MGIKCSSVDAFTVKSIKDEIQFAWEANGEGLFEIGLYNIATRKWQYFRGIKENEYKVKISSLGDGEYRVKVREMKKCSWSGTRGFAIDKLKYFMVKLAGGDLSKAQKENIERLNEEIKQRKTILESYPLSMSVILEGRGCNISCIYCTHWWGEKDKGYTFGTPSHLIKDLKNFFPYLIQIAFGGGEPLMYPEFHKILDMAEDYPSLQISLTTNGLSLSKDQVRRICLMNFSWLRFSVDAATPQSYGKVRLDSRLSKILQVCEWIQEFKKGQLPKVQWNYVIMDWNYKEMVAFVELAWKFGVDVVNFKMLIPSHLANSKFQQIQKIQNSASSKSELVDLFDLDISRNLDKSRELLGIVDEVKMRAEKYKIQILDDQVLPYILKHFPGFSGDKIPFENSDQYLPDFMNKSNPDIIEYCKGVEKGVTKVNCETGTTDMGQSLYLDTLIEDQLPSLKHILERDPVTSLEEILEEAGILTDEGVSTIAKDVSFDKSCFSSITKDPEFNQVVPDFFCTLPFTNFSWGDYRFQPCCYVQPFFSYTNFTDEVKSLMDIWNSSAMQRMRQFMYDGRVNRTCKRTCPHYMKGGAKSYLK